MTQDYSFHLLSAVLFDLDGTLLNSLPGIEYSARAAFRACGLPMAEVDLRSLIGPPIRTILSRLFLNAPAEGYERLLDCLEQAFRASYDSEGWQKTYHYAGAFAMLTQMKEQGIRLFVVSNKPRHISLKILEAEGTLQCFDEVVTRDSRTPPYRSKYEMISHVSAEQALQPESCLMVGDTIEDANAAAMAGIQFALMTHGYGYIPSDGKVPVALRLDSFVKLMQCTDRSVQRLKREHQVD